MGAGRSRQSTLDRRRAVLVATLGFLQLAPKAPALRALHAWLDDWRGVGLIIEGMHRQGFTVSLRTTAVDRGWLASFQADPITSPAGFATALTPWAAVQHAAWIALRSTAH